jgi:nucleoprotein TPR
MAKYTQARMELEKLRSEHAELSVERTTTMFTKEKLEQQLQLAKAQLEWTTTEYHKSQEESSQSAKEKSRQVQKLLSQVDELTHQVTHLERSYKVTTEKLHEREHQLSEIRRSKIDLEAQLSNQEEEFKHELHVTKELVSSKTQLVEEAHRYADRLNNELSHSRTAHSMLEEEFLEYRQEQEQREVKLTEEIEALRDACEELERRLKVIDERNLDLQIIAGQSVTSQAFPSSALVGKALQSGKTYSQLWSELVEQENEVAFLQSRVTELETGLQTILCEMEERAPLYARLNKENEELRETTRDLNSQVVQMERQKLAVLDQCQKWKENSLQVQEELDENRRLLSDLSHQLSRLLAGMNANDVVNGLRELVMGSMGNDDLQFEENALQNEITESLVEFSSVEGLVQRNQELLKEIRRVTSQNEELEGKLNRDVSSELEKLQREREELEIQLKAARMAPNHQPMRDRSPEGVRRHDVEPMPHMVTEEQLQLRIKVEHMETICKDLQQKLHSTEDKLTNKVMDHARIEAQLKFIMSEKELCDNQLVSLRNELQHSTTKSNTYAAAVSQWEERYCFLDEKVHRIQSSLELEKRAHATAIMENEVLSRAQDHLQASISQLVSERDMLRNMLQESQGSSEKQMEEITALASMAQKRAQTLDAEVVTLRNKLEALQEGQNRMLLQHSKEVMHHERISQGKINEAARRLSSCSPVHSGGNVVENVVQSKSPRKMSEESKREEEIEQQSVIEEQKASISFLTDEIVRRDRQLAEFGEKSSKFESKISELNQMLKKSVTYSDGLAETMSELKAQLEEKETLINNLSEELQVARRECIEATNRATLLEEAQGSFDALKEELEKDRDSANENYRREIQSHALDLQALDSSNQRLNEMSDRIRSLEFDLQAVETEKVELIAQCDSKLAVMRQNLEKMEETLGNVREQNDSLYAQLSSGDSPSDLINLLRSERNALLVEKEASVLEATRHAHQLERRVETLKAQLEEASNAAANEEVSKLRIQNEEQQHQVSLLRESNTTLRKEKNRFEGLYAKTRQEYDDLSADLQKYKEQQASYDADISALRSAAEKHKSDAQEWQSKYATMLHKIERVDPEHHQQLIQKVQQLESQVEQLQKAAEDATAERSNTIAKANQTIRDGKTKLAALRAEKMHLEQERASLTGQLEEKSRMLGENANSLNEIQELKAQNEKIESEMQILVVERDTLLDELSKKKDAVRDLMNKLVSFRATSVTPKPKRPLDENNDQNNKKQKVELEGEGSSESKSFSETPPPVAELLKDAPRKSPTNAPPALSAPILALRAKLLMKPAGEAGGIAALPPTPRATLSNRLPEQNLPPTGVASINASNLSPIRTPEQSTSNPLSDEPAEAKTNEVLLPNETDSISSDIISSDSLTDFTPSLSNASLPTITESEGVLNDTSNLQNVNVNSEVPAVSPPDVAPLNSIDTNVSNQQKMVAATSPSGNQFSISKKALGLANQPGSTMELQERARAAVSTAVHAISSAESSNIMEVGEITLPTSSSQVISEPQESASTLEDAKALQESPMSSTQPPQAPAPPVQEPLNSGALKLAENASLVSPTTAVSDLSPDAPTNDSQASNSDQSAADVGNQAAADAKNFSYRPIVFASSSPAVAPASSNNASPAAQPGTRLAQKRGGAQPGLQKVLNPLTNQQFPSAALPAGSPMQAMQNLVPNQNQQQQQQQQQQPQSNHDQSQARNQSRFRRGVGGLPTLRSGKPRGNSNGGSGAPP